MALHLSTDPCFTSVQAGLAKQRVTWVESDLSFGWEGSEGDHRPVLYPIHASPVRTPAWLSSSGRLCTLSKELK